MLICLIRPLLSCFPDTELRNINRLVLISSCLARDARERFAKGNSGNPRGRPRGVPNPRQRVPDLVAKPLRAQALSDLINRKPHLLRPLAAQLVPPPPASIESAKRLGIDVSSLRAVEDSGRCRPPFWRPLRATRSRQPRARASRGGCVPGWARSGASHDWSTGWRRRDRAIVRA